MEGKIRWVTREERRDRRLENMTEAEAADDIRRGLRAQISEAEKLARKQEGTLPGRSMARYAASLQRHLDDFNAEFPPER